MALSLVVDADGHCSEPMDELAEYLPREYADRGPRSITDNRGSPRLLLESRVWGKGEGLGQSVAGPFAEHIKHSRPGMNDPLLRLPDMDEEGIDVAIIFGTPIALTVNGLEDKGLAAAICHAVNRWLSEEY